jgi:hypothetical protein
MTTWLEVIDAQNKVYEARRKELNGSKKKWKENTE